MGAARLLAKAWVVFCLFAGAHALTRALAHAPLHCRGTDDRDCRVSVLCDGAFVHRRLRRVVRRPAARR